MNGAVRNARPRDDCHESPANVVPPLAAVHRAEHRPGLPAAPKRGEHGDCFVSEADDAGMAGLGAPVRLVRDGQQPPPTR